MAETVTQNATVQTTTGANTVLWTLTLDDNTLYWIEAKIIGRDTGGTKRAYYVREVYAYRQGGGIATLGTVQTPISDETTAAWNATFGVDGANAARVLVAGEAAVTINWSATIRYGKVS